MRRIIIIDDDTYILTTFSQVLTKRGYEVSSAETGAQAIEKLREARFDVALIDVCLPDMTGTELLEKAKTELEPTIKIMLTGYPSTETKNKAAIEGADTYIVKPIKIDELISVINFFLKAKEEK